MNEVDALELVQNALWTTMWICVPLVLPAMAVGIIVALFQALTQIQESTLTFVPKMIVVFISAMASAALSALKCKHWPRMPMTALPPASSVAP